MLNLFVHPTITVHRVQMSFKQGKMMVDYSQVDGQDTTVLQCRRGSGTDDYNVEPAAPLVPIQNPALCARDA